MLIVLCVLMHIGFAIGILGSFDKSWLEAVGITLKEQARSTVSETEPPEKSGETAAIDKFAIDKSVVDEFVTDKSASALESANNDEKNTSETAGGDARISQEQPAEKAGDVKHEAADDGPSEIVEDTVVRGTMEKGDTVGKILEKNSEQGVQSYIQATQQVFSLRSFRTGQPYAVVTDSAGRIKRFEYEIDARRRLVVEGGENPVARLEAIEYVTTLAVLEAVIDDNLFQAAADIGESPQLALRLADLFGAEINFIRELQEGDSFAVLIEKRRREGNYAGYGRILAARFTNRGKIFEAFLFRDGEQAPRHYNRKGENLRKTLLQSPLAFTRISSRFSMNRPHPVLGVNRPHPGVDYAAPSGTPVKAVGDGIVTGKGWAGGYGNHVAVKHSAGLESLYSHLSGYARGVNKGVRVRQGQVIGFVGSTGLATGPHLDFRLRQNGRFINPLKAVNPRAEPVSLKNRKEFERVAAEELALLDGVKSLDDYTVESLVPEHIVLDTIRPGEIEKGKTPAKTTSGKKRRQRN